MPRWRSIELYACPRKYIKVIQRLYLDCKWLIYYINTTEGVPKEVVYCNPVEGGNFVMKDSTFCEYKFLRYLVMTKPLCATILTQLSAVLEKRNVPHKINPMAVASEMINIRNIRALIIGHSKKEQQWAFNTQYNRHCINFTLVMHSVGSHLDFFADGYPNL